MPLSTCSYVHCSLFMADRAFSLEFLRQQPFTKNQKTSSKMLKNSLVNPSTTPFPIFSPKPASRNRLNVVQIPRCNSLEVELSKSFSNTKPSSSTPPYPGGMGPHTGRDPNVKKPDWLRQRAPQGEKFARLKDSIGELKLNTVCVEAQCPNIGEVLLFQIIFLNLKLFHSCFPRQLPTPTLNVWLWSKVKKD